jgi:VWFA-related protein
MRRTLICAALICAVAIMPSRAAQETQPRFRARVDLLIVDVAAVDSRGRPVEDLRAGDFTVKVDGKVRPIVSAELVKVERGTTPAPVRPLDALISTNQSPQNARRIVVAVDQTLITPGSLTPLLRTASQFVDRLAPSDYAAFIGFPEPGPRVDFTTDKGMVRQAMQSISIGQPAKIEAGLFDISLYEAFTITGEEGPQNSSVVPGGPPPGPTMMRVIERGCKDVPADQCQRQIYSESLTIVATARQDATISLRALEALLKDLVPLDGPKSMVVFSAGIVNEDPTVLDEVAQLAAQARTTINVIAVERQREVLIRNDTGASRPSALIDRQFEMNGLELIADRTGGTLFRGIASGAGIFDRLESELSAWYVVAVERQPTDPERQRVEVDVRRKGVSVKSNKTVIARAPNSARSLDELLSETLSSPFALPGIPLRVTTFAQRDAAPGTYQVRIAAQIGQPGEPAGEFGVGYVLTDEKGRVLTKAGSRRTLARAASGGTQALMYDTALNVAAGTYLLRFGVVDKEGRRGAVVRRLEIADGTSTDIASGDLIIGNLPADGESLHPAVEPQVTASELAGYLEVYPSDADRDRLAVRLEIAEGEASPALSTAALTIRPGENPSRTVATGFVEATMAPGRYVARARILRDGVAVKTLSRPFTIVRDPAVVSRPATRSRGVPIAPGLQQRTAAYVAGVVGGLANVVAREDFALSKPDRRVTSDLLLVRYPGAVRDLLSFRDVSAVNGTPVPGREQRLLDLFVKPTDQLRERARQIMIGADQFVPSAFNPVFVLGFLQSDFQSRFDLTVADAGSDWPREVKAVTFVETGRPTLLRTGTFGDLDVPTRGTAWIEEGTGRILQTELQIGRGKSMPTMVTKFKLDERLQVMVPVEMRTQNPDGLATYSNFRRFDVSTDAAIDAGRPN